MARRFWLALEWLALFVMVPGLLAWQPDALPWLIPFAVIVAYALGWLSRRGEPWRELLWYVDAARERRLLRPVLVRTALGIALLAIFVALLFPQDWLSFPRQRPWLWIAVMLLYPLFSVFTQELLYRGFFFRRYRALFPQPHALQLMSALSFAWMHVVFGNIVAPLLTLVGGALFAWTFQRSGSLRLVCLEHMLYGQAVFTLGLGTYFYDPRFLAV